MKAENIETAKQLVEELQKRKALLGNFKCQFNLRSVTFSPYIGLSIMIDYGCKEVSQELLVEMRDMTIKHLEEKIVKLEKEIELL